VSPYPDHIDHGARRAVVQIAALFHDMGKATNLMQRKLRRSLTSPSFEVDAIRHEVFSAFVWDEMFGDHDDAKIVAALASCTGAQIDRVMRPVKKRLQKLHNDCRKADGDAPIKLNFLENDGTIAMAVGHLILSHHRLCDGSDNYQRFMAGAHVRGDLDLTRECLDIAPGAPYWHEPWFKDALQDGVDQLRPGIIKNTASVEIALRTSLMFGDHMGSALKALAAQTPDHLANTGSGRPMDSLSLHTQRVVEEAGHAYEMLYEGLSDIRGLEAKELPEQIVTPENDCGRFAWQSHAAASARHVVATQEGGFFGCLFAGTGTGKTRGAPTVLTAAVMADRRESRRNLRATLGLGLRTLATQSAQEYVDDLGFDAGDVSMVIGQPPMSFEEYSEASAEGSESHTSLPDWLNVRMTDQAALPEAKTFPSFYDRFINHTGKRAANARSLIEPPVTVCTVDHLMSIADPARSKHMLATIRMMSSDLILDEIDQYSPEDIAAIARLIYQVGAAGRRVIIMSATMTCDIALTLHDTYARGWARYAAQTGMNDHVHLLCTGDTPDSYRDNRTGAAAEAVISDCIAHVLQDVTNADVLRKTEILTPVEGWEDLVDQISTSCSHLHDKNAVEVAGYYVSFGLARMTRISHTAALAVQLPAGEFSDRLRVKICLHSNMPRVIRSWIEMRLKAALTRKGGAPNAGIEAFCREEGLFEQAARAGLRDIEIVLVSSPVVETGTDYDFDWAVLDPYSIRSLIQTAGRVRRHRSVHDAVNVHVLGRPVAAMQGGRIDMPGVETQQRAARVIAPSLEAFEGRHICDLIGPSGLECLDASLMLDMTRDVPLRTAEMGLCTQMIDTNETSPGGRYLANLRSRMNTAVSKRRKFRRSVSRDILYTLVGDDLDTAVWHIDLAPGGRDSHLGLASERGFRLSDSTVKGMAFAGDLARRAFDAYTQAHPGFEKYGTSEAFETCIADYSSPEDGLVPEVSYHAFTGLTRGSFESLLKPFGRD